MYIIIYIKFIYIYYIYIYIYIVEFETKDTIIYQRYNNISLMIIFTYVHIIQASQSRFVIVTQIMSSQNKEREDRFQ